MPVRRVPRPARRPQVAAHHVDNIEAADRMADAIVEQVEQQRRNVRSTLTADLIVGDNRLNHNLGRLPLGVSLTPTVADATFAWALSSRTATQIVITVVGVDQPGAFLEVY